ncbi:DgyrCDS11641 [Dimorphilus gyrociliatus]|uniref:SURF1-like protein n=1 Tax=Dimorphilus gyrociliatus TaxID=2664684 RepID=A0A7I8W514_9ANNE|nr:DgyrCDS11641 [Dimorphilus gyrociliatus]
MQSSHSEGGNYALLVVPLAAAALGTWQVQRRKWKLGLIEDLQKRTTAEPVELPVDFQELEDMEYRKVKVTGRFDHRREICIEPRSRLESDDSKRSGLGSSSATIGAHIITPFILEDRNSTILINRGWVPRGKVKPNSRPEGQINNTITLTGVVRTTEKRQYTKNKPEMNQWFNRDVEEMSYYLDTDPVFLDADHSSTIPGGPIGGQTRVTLRNEHFSYIITW